jgi:peptide/nickel transport system substrate-binding protein
MGIPRKMTSLLMCAVLGVGVMAACSPGNNKKSSSTKKRDTINYAINVDTKTLDPQYENDNNSEQIIRHMYETLLVRSSDGPQPHLAESWSISEDKLTWTFNLQKGIKFHDGTELTSDDAVATFRRVKELGAGRTPTGFAFVDAIDKVDEYTFTIQTTEPMGGLLFTLTDPAYSILDDAAIKKYGTNIGTTVEAENGTGPYKLVSWELNNKLLMESFEDYWKGKPPTKYLSFITIPESSSRLAALENGEVDVIEKFTFEDLEHLRQNPEINVTVTPTDGYRIFQFGADDPIMSNSKIREALIYAVDRQAVIDALYGETAEQPTSVIGKNVFAYKDLGAIKPDLNKAKQLLAEAGYPNGFKTKIVTTPRYEKGVEMAEILKSQLEKIGVNAQIEVIDWTSFVPMISGLTPEEFDWPIFIMGVVSITGDADSAFRGLFTTSETGKNNRNYGFYSNSEVDELVAKAATEIDQIKRKEYYEKVQKILYLEDPSGIWMWGVNYTTASNAKLKNITIHPIGEQTFENAVFE